MYKIVLSIAPSTREVTMDRTIEPISAHQWYLAQCREYGEAANLDLAIVDTTKRVRDDFALGEGYAYVHGHRSMGAQIRFVSYELARLWRLESNGEDDLSVAVVSTHRSKSITLPVCRLTVPNVGLFYLRNNFYNWKVSCELEVPLPIDTWGDLFDPTDARSISDVFCEGFDPAWVHGPFGQNQQAFTVELSRSNEHLFAFMWALRLQMCRLGRVTPLFSQ